MENMVKRLLLSEESTYSIAKHSNVPEQTVRNLRNNITNIKNVRYQTIKKLYQYAGEVLDLKIKGVKFTDKNQYEAVTHALESAEIEGFNLNDESIQHVKRVLDGEMTIAQIAQHYLQKEQSNR